MENEDEEQKEYYSAEESNLGQRNDTMKKIITLDNIPIYLFKTKRQIKL